jgi:hypothetical protein
VKPLCAELNHFASLLRVSIKPYIFNDLWEGRLPPSPPFLLAF